MLAVLAIGLAGALLVLVLLVSIAMLRSAKRLECAQLRDELVDAARLGQLDVGRPRVFGLIDWFDRVAATGRLIAVGRHTSDRQEFGRLTDSLMNAMSPTRRQFAPVGPTYPLGTAWPGTVPDGANEAGADVEDRAIRYQQERLGRRRPGRLTLTRSALTEVISARSTVTRAESTDSRPGAGAASASASASASGSRSAPGAVRTAGAERTGAHRIAPASGDAGDGRPSSGRRATPHKPPADHAAARRPSGRRAADHRPANDVPPDQDAEPALTQPTRSAHLARQPDRGTSDPMAGPDSSQSLQQHLTPAIAEPVDAEPILAELALPAPSIRSPLPALTPSLVDLSPRRQRRGGPKPTFIRTASLLPEAPDKSTSRARIRLRAGRPRLFAAGRRTSTVLRPAISLPGWLTSRRSAADDRPPTDLSRADLSRKQARRKPLTREEAVVVTGRGKPQGALMPVTGPIQLPTPLLSPGDLALDDAGHPATGSPPLSLAEQIFAIPSQ